MRTGHEKEKDKRGNQRRHWDGRVVRSLGDGVRVVPMERMVAVRITTRVNLGLPQAPSAGRSFNEMRGSHAFCLDHCDPSKRLCDRSQLMRSDGSILPRQALKNIS